MAAAPFWNIYAGMEFLTPGARETVDIASTLVPRTSGARILDVAYGKGTGSFLLAERHDCIILGLDVHSFAARVARYATTSGCADRVAFAIGDGGRLPVRAAAFDVAMCVGGPSIIGTDRCIAEMARVLRPGGAAVVSDWVWARKPVPPGAIPLGYDVDLLTLDEYAGIMRRAGLEVVSAEPLPQSAWDAYYGPIRGTVASMRAHDRTAPYQPVEDEIRLYDAGVGPEWWRYAVFVGRKP